MKHFAILLSLTLGAFSRLGWAQCTVTNSITAAPSTCTSGTQITGTSASKTSINSAITYYASGVTTVYADLSLNSGPTVINVCSGATMVLTVSSLNTTNLTINILKGGTMQTSFIEKYTVNVYGNLVALSDISLQNSPHINIDTSGTFSIYPYNLSATSSGGSIVNLGTLETNNVSFNTVPAPFICMGQNSCTRIRGSTLQNDNTPNPFQATSTGGYLSLAQTTGSTLNKGLANSSNVSVCLATASTNFCVAGNVSPCSGSANLFNGASVNPSSCSNGVGSLKCLNPLPISLAYFQATLAEKKVVVQWATAQQIRSAYFVVERSTNGADWEEIGQQKALGNSTDFTTYSIIDPSPLPGPNYYRLKEIGTDGKETISPVAVVTISWDELLFLLFPNPSSGKMTLRLGAQFAKYSVDILDVRGIVVGSYTFFPGDNFFSISTPGMYIARLKLGHDLKTEKFVIQ